MDSILDQYLIDNEDPVQIRMIYENIFFTFGLHKPFR